MCLKYYYGYIRANVLDFYQDHNSVGLRIFFPGLHKHGFSIVFFFFLRPIRVISRPQSWNFITATVPRLLRFYFQDYPVHNPVFTLLPQSWWFKDLFQGLPGHNAKFIFQGSKFYGFWSFIFRATKAIFKDFFQGIYVHDPGFLRIMFEGLPGFNLGHCAGLVSGSKS